MGKKTLGIIGKGNLIRHFFDSLANGVKSTSPLTKEFDAEIGRIMFYDERYQTAADYRNTKEFKEIEGSLLAFTSNNLLNIDSLLSTDVSLPQMDKSSLQVGVMAGDSQKTFETFFTLSDVIVDAIQGYAPKSLEVRVKSIYSTQKLVPELTSNPMEEDYKTYCINQLQSGKITMKKELFEQHWNISHVLINKLGRLHEEQTIGQRTLTVFPFSTPIMQERGKQIQEIINKGYTALPTYIMITNEPCLASSVLTDQCPSMISRMVALTGFDLERLEEVLNTEYSNLKQKVGLANKKLAVSLTGFHDNGVMVPVIYPKCEADQELFARVLSLVDYRLMHNFLRQEVEHYFGTHQKELTSSQVDESLCSTIIAAARSKGRALSLQPSNHTLCNGYAQSSSNSEFVFLTGSHHFSNGKVIGKDIPMKHEGIHTFIEQERNRTVDRFREIRAVIHNIMGNPTVEAAVQSQKLSPLASSLEWKCFVAQDRGVIQLDYNNELWTARQLQLLSHHYTELAVLMLDGLPYLAAGYSRGIEIYNPHGEEQCSITINQNKNRSIGFKSLAVIVREGVPYLVSSHSNRGIISCSLYDLRQEPTGRLNVAAEQYWMDFSKEKDAHLRMKVTKKGIYIAAGKKLFFDQLGKGTPKQVAEYSYPITVLDIDSQEKWVVGLEGPQLFHQDTKLLGENTLGSYIARVQCVDSYQNKAGILFTTGHRTSLNSKLSFADGTSIQEVLNAGLVSSIHDFHYQSGKLFCLLPDKVVVKEKAVSKELLLLGKKEARHFCVYGGK